VLKGSQLGRNPPFAGHYAITMHKVTFFPCGFASPSQGTATKVAPWSHGDQTKRTWASLATR